MVESFATSGKALASGPQVASAVETFILTDLSGVPEHQAPHLCEIWNWQGDTTVLPYKWAEVLNAVSGQEEAYDHKGLKSTFVQSSKFDPMAFFFLTYRSHAIGLCMVWPTGMSKEYEIKHLCSVPSHRDKGVETCLLSLALEYCANKGASKVFVKFDEALIQNYQSQVVKPILLDKFGFTQVQ